MRPYLKCHIDFLSDSLSYRWVWLYGKGAALADSWLHTQLWSKQDQERGCSLSCEYPRFNPLLTFWALYCPGVWLTNWGPAWHMSVGLCFTEKTGTDFERVHKLKQCRTEKQKYVNEIVQVVMLISTSEDPFQCPPMPTYLLSPRLRPSLISWAVF